jgi:hypothetical protein
VVSFVVGGLNKRDPVDFSDIAHVKWWKADTVINKSVDTTFLGSPISMFCDTVKNAQFNTDIRDMFSLVVRLVSKNNDKWADRDYQFMIGRTPPKTPIKFNAEAHDASTIRLTWTWDTLICNPDSVRVDSFRIWYAADTAVPLTNRFDTAIYKRVIPEPGISDGGTWVSGLQENTLYYFGAQMYLGSSSPYLNFNAGLWSEVTPKTPEIIYSYWDDSLLQEINVYDTMWSVDSAVTWGRDSSRIRNTIRIDTSTTIYNPATHNLTVRWSVDLMGYESLLLGISYCPRDPSVSWDSLIALLDSALPVNGITLTAKTADSSFTINLDQRNYAIDNGSLVFDTAYYVMLWLRKSGEKWGAPTAISVDTFSVLPFTWQTTRYVFNPAVADTSFWVNGRVRFVVPVGGSYTVDAKIQEFTPGSSMLNGFLPVAQGFSFIDRKNSNTFQIGVRCDIPPGQYSLSDVRIYRYDSDTYQWRVERSTAMDTASSIVFISTGGGASLRAPFIPMIDTIPPQIAVLTDTASALPPMTPVTDSFEVWDNIANLKWWFYSARGDDRPLVRNSSDSGIFTQIIDTVPTRIDSNYLTPANGARAMLIADDGRFRDTADISRRVVRDANTVISTELKWVPLQVTAALDSPSITRLWQFVPEADGQYDKRHVRLFRFLSDASNAGSAANAKWVEYEPGRESIFELKPGRLLWIKTRESVTFPLGRGITLALQNDDTVALESGGWTDFSLTHSFNMRMGDIYDYMANHLSTQDFNQVFCELQFYRWVDSGSSYWPELLYCGSGSIPGADDKSQILVGDADRSGFTVYNQYSSITLLIPPISVAMSPYSSPSPPPKKAAGPATSWAVKLMPKTDRGAGLSSVFCGYNEALHGSGWYPMPPTWSKLSLGVLDEKSGSLYGHRMLRSTQNNGASYMLAFRNDTACGRSISVKLERIAGFPASLKTAVYDPSTGETQELASADDAFTLSADAGATSCRWLFVGDATYVASAAKFLSVRKLAFEKIFPNPARGLVRLRYSVPFAHGKVRFTILDISGRTLWSRTIEEQTPLGGSRECRWDGTSSGGKRIAAGVLIVRMEAFDEKGKTAGSFSKRLTFLP